LALKLFHLLGGVYFAIFLVLSAALFVIVGTGLESWTDSHAFAAKWTYSHPLFQGLLALFFLNIFLAALRRWPFKKRHIPFLMTHLGLLMIIGGTLTKNLFGVQGRLILKEGSGTGVFFLDHSEEVALIDSTGRENPIPDDVKVKHRFPHHEMKREHWVKGGELSLSRSPIQTTVVKEGEDCEVLLRECYSALIAPLKLDALSFEEGIVKGVIEGSPLFLSGPDALLGEITLSLPPTAFFLSAKNDEIVAYVDSHGRLYMKKFPKEKEDELVVYENGLQGYALECRFKVSNEGKEEKEERLVKELKIALRKAYEEAPVLSPVARALDPESLVDFMQNLPYEETLLPSTLELPSLDLTHFHEDDLKRAFWALVLLHDLKDAMKEKTLSSLEEEVPWKYLLGGSDDLKTAQQTLIKEMLVLDGDLPPHKPLNDLTPREKGELFAIFLIGQNLSLKTLLVPNESETQEIVFETPLSLTLTPKPPPVRLEESIPLLVLNWGSDVVSLPFDPTGRGLKWPTPDGQQLIDYRPAKKTLPVHIRLREAHTSHYPMSNRPYAFEAHLLVSENGNEQEVSLTMNHVFETWGGWRFYLSSISPQDESRAKVIQLVVNRDPVKYYLTYPGGLIASFGIIALLFRRRKL